jgi:hypothetical protein
MLMLTFCLLHCQPGNEPTDDKTALTVEESEEQCTEHHAHSHDHDEKPHKPKKKHEVNLHDVTGHSHDVVSGVIDDHGHTDADFGTFFLELGMYALLFRPCVVPLSTPSQNQN